MKIFEFAFNPKKRKDRFFEVFSYEPKSLKEKPKGSLYIIGELNNALEFNSRFLKRLSETIQREYYRSSLKGAAPALKVALKAANHFLRDESKKGNVDWLGNLHLAVLLFITVKEKKTMFHLAKTGNIKISLVRQGMVVDVGKNLESSSHQPGTVFGNLVSGALVPNDSITAASKEVFDVLSREKSLGGIGTLQEAKQFREFFSKRNRMLSLSSGVLVSFVIEEEVAKRSPINKSLLPRLRGQASFPKPRLMLPKGVKLSFLKLSLKFSWMRHPSVFKKQAVLILVFLALLLLGVLLF
ncbi:hypothetical protein IH982_01065 [Patescibacteria group bacterium]|nr:hypothetical protein [Patescibacteria group bacterium]